MPYICGVYTLDMQRDELRADDEVIQLDRQVSAVLAYLVQHHDRVVQRQELCEQLWPERFVSEAALEHCITVARRAVGENGQAQRVIKTIHGWGYRSVAPVEERPDAPPSAPPLATPPPQPLIESSPPVAMPGIRSPLSPSEAPERPLALGTPQQRTAATERRVLTVLYCELFDSQTRHCDPEEVQGIVDSV